MNYDYTPKKLFELLSRTVIGQDDYLKKLSNIVWLHNKRIEARNKVSKNTPLQKYNLLCVGPTGSGKTLAISTLAKLYGLDVGIFNAVDFTGAGWKGRDVSEIVQELYTICDKDVKRTEKAIVVLDEFDKMILQNCTELEPSFGASNSMLKLIEGMNVLVKDGEHTKAMIDTKDILFVAAGAFEGIEKIIQKRIRGKNTIGFNAASKEINEEEDIYKYVTKEDLMEYGMGSQILGRFTELAHLRRLGITELEDILLRSDTSAITCMDTLLGVTCGVEVEIDKNAAHVVAERAYDEKTGARGLSQIILPALQEIIFDMAVIGEKQKIFITTDENGCLDVQLKTVYKTVKESNVIKTIPIQCKPQKNKVECFVDYIMSACPEVQFATIREIRAAHALLCSLIFYIILECNKDDQTIEGLKKLLYVATPSKDPDTGKRSVAEVILFESSDSMDYNFYYEKFLYLDDSYRSAELAQKAVEAFSVNPEFELKSIYHSA